MRTETGLIVPTVGKDGLELYTRQLGVILELQHAAAGLKLIAPRRQDGEYPAAVQQHSRWVSKIASVLVELTEVTDAIRQQLERSK